MRWPGTLIRGGTNDMVMGWFDGLMRDVRHAAARGVMARLRTDRRGNALAIMAAGLIPMAGMVGGGIDLSRMYIVKTRLQHACDAGVLAGRKAMGSGTWSQSSYMPRTRAEQFFDANWRPDSYGSTGSTKTFTENAGTVTGNASATVPMTLMRVLGKTTENIAVTCEAEMRLPNTDVMFVLDTTGSMADTPTGDTQSKMASLKESVKCFYEIVARLDTDANCTTGTPSGGTGNQVQVRFGFMPYSTNVNVGKLLPTAYFANSWKYQSRIGRWWVATKTKITSKNISQSGVAQADCNDAAAAAAGYNSYNENVSGPVQSPTYPTGTKRNIKRTDTHVTGWSNNVCYGTQTSSDIDSTLTEGVTPTTNDEWEDWRYNQITTDISGLKSGTNWSAGFNLPIATTGATRAITWDGCIEERPTVRQLSYNPIPSGAYDLNIDLVPTSGTATSLWGPALQQLIYTRAVVNNVNQLTTAESYTTTDYLQPTSYGGYTCPVQAKKLQAWADANAFDDYVDTLTPAGNTYHDIGLLWGARFASPTGIFSSENALTSQGGEIDRHMIFMTDGDACTSTIAYNAYGIAYHDRRETPLADIPTDGCTETGTLTQQVNVRTEALCTAIKNKNITLWVIAFGTLAATTEARLQNCASSGRYFQATNAATLQQTFKSIADQISALRITK